MDFNILDFGAKGDGKTNDSQVIQEAINQCSQSGGGTVKVPAGRNFLSGPFQLKSNVNLHLENNAIIKASLDETLYTESAFKENRSEGSIWISARNADNISITGGGVIDSQGTSFMLSEEPTHYNYKIVDNVDMRPHLLTTINCKNVTLKDVTFKDAAYWCIHLIGCEDVVIDSIRILNSLKVRNCDGIDIDHSKNVRISNCYIESADDCICLKTRREYSEYGPTENVTVTGCVLISTSCSIKLGSENVDAIRNIVFNSIIINASNRALGIQNRDEGIIENVIFSNITIKSRLFSDIWWGKAEPIYITSLKRSPKHTRRFAPGNTEPAIGEVRNIQFINIIGESENGVYVAGCRDSYPSDILFDNVKIKINKWTKHKGGIYDNRPCEGLTESEGDIRGLVETYTAGFYLYHCNNITIRDSQIQWGNNRPDYYGPALYYKDVVNLSLENFTGEAAHPDRFQTIIKE